ncbi:MAG: Asp-tRNA(Asn)/Glu-tRNA(Gln) amidotransferase subunit GatB, partial [Candidatus Pacebacteria bacterium]|nr:Asp-tRNA(Asn)/Glu-tRNA(Gln) amidotransferase subunit GatB [Candidatus Paceibacterota bacterium]
SLVDFNRAGIPLMELVTEPDLNSAEDAKRFAEELHRIFHYLNVSDADMEKGQMRVEVNISLMRTNASTNNTNNIRGISGQISGNSRKLGTKVEIKNLNSFRAVERSIEYEIKRQEKLLEKGEKVVQETRGWDDAKGQTFSQRAKEEAHDYRYFPEPDLPILHLGTPEFINKIKSEIPELPQQKRERFKREYEMAEAEIEIFIQNKELGEYFEKVISEFEPKLDHKKLLNLIKLTSNYLISDLLGLLKGASVAGEKFLITPENFSEFISLIETGRISSKAAKMVLSEMFAKGGDPSNIIKEKGLEQVSDTGELESVIADILKNNPKVVEDYKNGRTNAFQFLVGQIMAKTKGKANPKIVQEILTKLLTK